MWKYCWRGFIWMLKKMGFHSQFQKFEWKVTSSWLRSKSGRINDVVKQNLRLFRALTWSILSKVLTLYKQNTINTRRSTAPTTQTGITQFGSFLEGAATLVSGVNSVPTCVRITEALLTKRDVTIYYLLTESEVIKGKSQTEALMYWPSDSEINTSRPR